MFQHRTRSGHAWSCRVDDHVAMVPRPASTPLSGGPAAHGTPVSEPLHDAQGVKEEAVVVEGGREVCGFVKDLRSRRIFTPSSHPMECFPDQNGKAAVAEDACSPVQVETPESGQVAEACEVKPLPGVINATEETLEEVSVLGRGPDGGGGRMFQAAGSLEEGDIQSTPSDLHVISKLVGTADGFGMLSQPSGRCADEGFRHKQKNWSDQSHSMLGIVPCSRLKLVRDPKSFSYRRLLPFLKGLERSSSNSSEALLCRSHTLNVEKPKVEKSITLFSSPPTQAKVNSSEKMSKDLIGHMEEMVNGLMQQGNDSLDIFSGNSKDSSHDAAGSCTQYANLSPKFDANEFEMICKSSSIVPATTEGLSLAELVGGTQDLSDLPIQPKVDSGMMVNGCVQLSTRTFPYGVPCPLGAKHSLTRGILKRHGGGCIGHCTCLDCASFRLHAERAFEFSKRQMQEAEDVAMGLINELSCLRKLVESHHMAATCVTRNDIHHHGQDWAASLPVRKDMGESIGIVAGEAQLILLRKEIDEIESRCTAETERMMSQVEKREHELDILEQEAEKFLNVFFFCHLYYLLYGHLNLRETCHKNSTVPVLIKLERNMSHEQYCTSTCSTTGFPCCYSTCWVPLLLFYMFIYFRFTK